ncbi:hypothetical protein AKJ09_01439 [Labilithrix luteola]|uniref:Uncharacterized protein n=1 Tax=Labilithrix luteola TaxID=1391654 RepID=A0A0K1PML8_9BACT|nr:hypothetical protein [Labilithrix luteola]AKU94775.1 hypothetical protein AKJ09_01439 [Labilithrix luteola]
MRMRFFGLRSGGTALLLAALSAMTVGAVGAAGCSGSTDRSLDGYDSNPKSPSADGGNSTGNTGGGTLGNGTTGDGGAGSQGNCSDAAKLVYVVSAENVLYSFAPDKLAFKEIGELDCPSSGATPNSMAVDRSGTAWVNFSDGSLFKVSTKDASCKPTDFQPGQHGFGRFGMAFASNSAGSEDETLYVAGIEGLGEGQGLAKIDLATFELTPLGNYSGDLRGMGAELTGTGEGKLFGFFTTFPNATLASIDKAKGATSNGVDLEGVFTGQAWAFSFWGGDFWFYTSPGDVPSTVTRLAASGDNSIEVVKEDVGNVGRIVGAGVSTCAPTAPPH